MFRGTRNRKQSLNLRSRELMRKISAIMRGLVNLVISVRVGMSLFMSIRNVVNLVPVVRPFAVNMRRYGNSPSLRSGLLSPE